jgi:hypothetical protein
MRLDDRSVSARYFPRNLSNALSENCDRALQSSGFPGRKKGAAGLGGSQATLSRINGLASSAWPFHEYSTDYFALPMSMAGMTATVSPIRAACPRARPYGSSALNLRPL